MTEEKTPAGFILSSLFFILTGVIMLSIFSMTFFGPSYLHLLLTLLSIFYILVGWGVLTQQRWALIFAIVLSGIPLCSFPSIIMSLFLQYGERSFNILLFVYYLSSLMVFIYLIYSLAKRKPP